MKSRSLMPSPGSWVFAEPGVKPVYPQDEGETEDNEQDHNSLNLGQALPQALIKRLAGDVKKSLKPAVPLLVSPSRKSLPVAEATMESQRQVRWLI